MTNPAFLINLQGVKILQMGDITIDFDKAYLEPLHLDKENMDILFMPYFDLSDASIKFVIEIIRPRYVIAKHLPPADFESESKKFQDVFPNGFVFEKAMESKVFKNNGYSKTPYRSVQF